MKELTITLTEEQSLKLKANSPLNTYDVINLCMNACLTAMNNNLPPNPDIHHHAIKDHLFDTFNEAASNVLAQFAPDRDLRPDLQEDAILKEEFKAASKKLKKKKQTR